MEAGRLMTCEQTFSSLLPATASTQHTAEQAPAPVEPVIHGLYCSQAGGGGKEYLLPSPSYYTLHLLSSHFCTFKAHLFILHHYKPPLLCCFPCNQYPSPLT